MVATPGVGRLRPGGCLRPVAEQLLSLVGPRPGETAVVVGGDGGVVLRPLASAVGAAGLVVVAEPDPLVLAGELHGTPRPSGGVWGTRTELGRLPLRSGCADLAVGLPTAVSRADPTNLVDEAVRCLRPTGRLALSAWDGRQGAPHEAAVVAAVEAVAGPPAAAVAARGLERARDLVAAAARHPALTVERRGDVVRFDSVADLFTALVLERGLLEGAGAVAGEARRVAWRVLDERMTPWTAADGTVRCPVTLVVVVRRPA